VNEGRPAVRMDCPFECPEEESLIPNNSARQHAALREEADRESVRDDRETKDGETHGEPVLESHRHVLHARVLLPSGARPLCQGETTNLGRVESKLCHRRYSPRSPIMKASG